MVLNVTLLVVFLLLIAVFAWLFIRFGRSPRPAVRTVGRIVSGLAIVGLAALSGIYGRGLATLYVPKQASALTIPVTGTSDQLARGEHLAQTLCAACHTTSGELPLSGGINLSDDVGMPMGDLFAPNITPGGKLAALTDADIWQLFRTGLLPSGRPAMMPIQALQHLSDEDLSAVIAYLRSQPAVDNEMKAVNPSPLAVVVVGAGMFPLAKAPVEGPVTAPPHAASAEYGEYIINFNDCRACHGTNLDGETAPGLPGGPDLAVVKGWTVEQFISAMRTGINPGGDTIDPPMPVRSIGKMDDTELTAMWTYLQSLP